MINEVYRGEAKGFPNQHRVSTHDVTTDDIIIRTAVSSDVHALQALIQRAYRGPAAAESWFHEGELPSGQRISCAALATLVERTDAMLSVAVGAEGLVGSSLVERDGPADCRIGLLSVDPASQNKGVGHRLLDHAERIARGRFGARHGKLEVLGHKPKLIGFYARRGYRPTGDRRPYPHALSAAAEFLVMAKPLLAEN